MKGKGELLNMSNFSFPVNIFIKICMVQTLDSLYEKGQSLVLQTKKILLYLNFLFFKHAILTLRKFLISDDISIQVNILTISIGIFLQNFRTS